MMMNLFHLEVFSTEIHSKMKITIIVSANSRYSKRWKKGSRDNGNLNTQSNEEDRKFKHKVIEPYQSHLEDTEEKDDDCQESFFDDDLHFADESVLESVPRIKYGKRPVNKKIIWWFKGELCNIPGICRKSSVDRSEDPTGGNGGNNLFEYSDFLTVGCRKQVLTMVKIELFCIPIGDEYKKINAKEGICRCREGKNECFRL